MGWEWSEGCIYLNLIDQSSWYPLRTLSKAMMKRIDLDYVKKHGELWPGGDVRIMGNQWLRSAYCDASLSKVPRENSFRECVRKIVRKNHLRSLLSSGVHMPHAKITRHTTWLPNTDFSQQRFWKDWWRTGSLDHRPGPLCRLYNTVF